MQAVQDSTKQTNETLKEAVNEVDVSLRKEIQFTKEDIGKLSDAIQFTKEHIGELSDAIHEVTKTGSVDSHPYSIKV